LNELNNIGPEVRVQDCLFRQLSMETWAGYWMFSVSLARPTRLQGRRTSSSSDALAVSPFYWNLL